MNHSLIRLVILLLLATATAEPARGQEQYDYPLRREAVDWCTITLKTRPGNGPDLPLVLLIGDSITVRYNSEVSAHLKDVAYVSLLGTSKAVGDPALLDELKLVLRQNRYAVIHFNYGLHGGIPGFRAGFADVLATLKQYAPDAKLIWATTTPCRQAAGGPDKAVQERNAIAAPLIAKAGIPIDDLYTLVANHPGDLWDGGGVHYSAEGTKLQSQQVARSIRGLLPVVNAESTKK